MSSLPYVFTRPVRSHAAESYISIQQLRRVLDHVAEVKILHADGLEEVHQVNRAHLELVCAVKYIHWAE